MSERRCEPTRPKAKLPNRRDLAPISSGEKVDTFPSTLTLTIANGTFCSSATGSLRSVAPRALSSSRSLKVPGELQTRAKKRRMKRRNLSSGLGPGEGGAAVRALDLLDIEPDFADSIGDESKSNNFVRRIERPISQNGDDVEGYALVLKQTRRAHGPLVSAARPARAPVRVMQFGRAIDAKTDLGIRSREEPRPSLVEQEAVGLEAMFELEARRAALLDEREGVLIPGERNDQRLAGVPRDLEALSDEPAVEDERAGLIHSLEAHRGRRKAVWQIAIGAVDVAERRRLQNEKPET